MHESPRFDNLIVSATCPICAHHGTVHLCPSFGYEVRRCLSCCCDFVWPRPGAEQLKAHYDDPAYFHGEGPGHYANYDLDTEPVLALFRNLLEEVPGSAPRSILDIGCAYGTHLAIAAEQGWDAFGVELSDHARQEARKRHGDKMAVFASVEEVPQREFELITLLDVIEHLPDPFEVLQTLFRKGHIGKRTLIAITTPNARSSHAVSDPQGWPYRHPPAHLVYYSAEALKRFWRKMGVLDVEVRGIYPQEQFPSASFPDEDSISNARLTQHAGLLCIASGFATSEPLIDATLNRIAAELAGVRAKLASYEEQANQRQARESEKLHAATAELHALKQTKWFQLRAALQERPLTVSSVARAAGLVGVMAVPRSVRPKLKALAFKVGKPEPDRTVAAPVPYRLRSTPVSLGARPRVLHVIANFMTGGSSRLVVDLVEHLSGKYEHSVLTSFIPTPPAYVGLEVRELSNPTSERPFVDHFCKVKPSFIHMHYWGDVDEAWYAKAVKAAEELGIPIVENINTPVKPYHSPNVQRYVYVSDYVREVFGQSGSNHVTVHPGSDFSHFRRGPDEVNQGDCVGMVYRLERDKLNEEAILPFIEVVKRRPKARVLIVGGGGLLEVFREAVISAGVQENFEFTGYVSYADLPDYYRRMGVFVAPVWKESFGQVSAFAMNMEIPVCGYDIGAIGEIIQDPSLVARPGDAEALAGIIVRLLDSPEERASQAKRLRQRAQEQFSVESMVASYATIYQDLLVQGRS